MRQAAEPTLTTSSSTDRCFTIKTVPNRGRGVFASTNIPKDAILFATPPDISVLYSAFGSCTCARCFCTLTRDSASNDGKDTDDHHSHPHHAHHTFSMMKSVPYFCQHCDQFALCCRCIVALQAEVASVLVQTGEKESEEMLFFRHPQLRFHALSCAWYNELPISVRRKGLDTDMLRFCLDYGARYYFAKRSDTATSKENHSTVDSSAAEEMHIQTLARQFVENIDALDDAESVQSDEVRTFCTVFARDRVVRTFGPSPAPVDSVSSSTAASQSETEKKKEMSTNAEPVCQTPRFPVPAEQLRAVLMRTQVNSLGYPFSASETMGWSLERTVCMLNHSCTPNAAVVPINSAETAEVKNGDDGADRISKSTCLQQHAATTGDQIGIQALREIKPHEEVTISYVDLLQYGRDVRERSRALLERYRFLCMCETCRTQRAELHKRTAETGR